MYNFLPYLAAALLPGAIALAMYPEAFTQDPDSTTQQHLAPTSDSDNSDDTPLPVVIWHGLGDISTGEGMKGVAKLIDDVQQGTYTYIVSLGADGDADRTASYFGDLNQQVETVCAALAADPILSSAPAIDAVGFSQGGQFLRAYVEKCNNPPVRNLLTFGSQHNGVRQYEKCKSALDFKCQAAHALLRSGGVWSNYVQTTLVPAQYYRDPEDLDSYLKNSHWLADINNEREVKNETYAKNLASLEHLVLLLFEEDVTVIPKESGWFAEVNVTSEEVTGLRHRPIYKEDWIGLKKLDKKGGLVFEKLAGPHMALSDKDLRRLFGKYFGPA